MKNSIMCLALFWMSAWLPTSATQESMPSSLVPTPETAKLVLATNDWLVWATRSIVAGTERNRAISYRMRFYVNRNPGESAHFVYEAITPGGYPAAGVLKDGTLVVANGGYRGEMLLVNPDGKWVEIAPPVRPTEFGRHGPFVFEVSDDGVLIQAYNLDLQGEEPVYFVPWASQGLDFDRKLLVTVKPGALIGWISRHEEKVVTLSREKLQVFNLISRQRVDYPAKLLVDAYQGEHLELQAADAETMIFASVEIKDAPITPIFDLRRGEFDYRTYLPDRVIAVKDRIVYSLGESEKNQKEGRASQILTATDLDSPGAERQVLTDLGLAEVVYIVRKDALLIWTNKVWKRIPWLSKNE